MRVALFGHHGKEQGIGGALHRAGFDLAAEAIPFDYDAMIVDSDHPDAPPAPHKHMILQECAKRRIPIILYPHGGPPDLDFDGLRPQKLPISMQLLHGEGHAEIYRRIGVKFPFEVVGWSFCETAERLTANAPAVSRLLFAPIHPWANGIGILPIHKGVNTAAYHQFLEHPAEQKTVRMYGTDEPNGITERRDDITYTQTDFGLGLDVIDDHDAVISFGTFAYCALARGKPTAMIYPYPGHTSDDGQRHVRHFDDYHEYCRYPATLGDAPLDDLFSRDVTEWKKLFVGEPLDEERLAWLIRLFKPNRAQRRKLAKTR